MPGRKMTEKNGYQNYSQLGYKAHRSDMVQPTTRAAKVKLGAMQLDMCKPLTKTAQGGLEHMHEQKDTNNQSASNESRPVIGVKSMYKHPLRLTSLQNITWSQRKAST